MKENKPMSAWDFACTMGQLEAYPVATVAIEQVFYQKSDHWWFSQRTHVVGYAARKAWEGDQKSPHATAKEVWSGLCRPEARLWVIEALGLIPESKRDVLIKQLIDAPLGTGAKKHQAHRDLLEKYFPWEDIEAAAQEKFDELTSANAIRYPKELRRR